MNLTIQTTSETVILLENVTEIRSYNTTDGLEIIKPETFHTFICHEWKDYTFISEKIFTIKGENISYIIFGN